MESQIQKVKNHLDSIRTFITPLLPLANSHMVEFFTKSLWDNLLPNELKECEDMELDQFLNNFWKFAKSDSQDNSELSKWMSDTQSYCLSVNNTYCISNNQLHERIIELGGGLVPEIKVMEFMSSKKSYEVQVMSRLVASLHYMTKSACCVEVGGGKGYLPVALTLGYNIPSLTVDCEGKRLATAETRGRIIQKQWHSIAKKINNGKLEKPPDILNNNLHRFAEAYVTDDTNLVGLVKEKFAEFSDNDINLLLTGIHTCGNLGPASLRLFASQSTVRSVCNVPCCYHLLEESTDVGTGFPVAEYTRGYTLGRNARMLAAQSIDRVVKEQQLPSKSLLYRALLQVIIEDYRPEYSVTEGKLKRITPICQTFEQYLKMADKVLNLKLNDELPPKYLNELCKDIEVQWKRIVIFYLIRLCLAQVIESVILLDRLLFLFEQGFENACLVKLFDPVLSPRCHCIVAVR